MNTRNMFMGQIAVLTSVIFLLCLPETAAATAQRAFATLGTGTGHDIWPDGKIPMLVAVTKQENKDHVSDTIAKAAAHIAARTCVQFYEVSSAPATIPYVTVKDDRANSCSAGYSYSSSGTSSGVLNYDGCKHKYLIVVHEMMHILGIGHEQKRIDSYDKLKVNESRVSPHFIDQYTPTFADAFGEYDFNSVMHYGNYAFDNGNGATFDAIRTGHRVQCGQMSDGDVEAVDFVSQSCWKEPILPRCKVSAPSGLHVGRLFDKNMSFTALYKAEKLVPQFTNLPEGAQVHHFEKFFGSVYMVQLKPTANDLGKNFTITASYTTSDGKATSCSIEVKVATSDYVCGNIASDDVRVCSGHGVCKSHDFPQCECAAGYDGPFCEGVSRCPADVEIDMEKDQQGRCYIPDESTDVTRVPGPNGEGYAANGTTLYFSLMRDVARQPVEMRALVKFVGGNDGGSQEIKFGWMSTIMNDRKLHGMYVDDSWHEVRTVYDWERRRYMEFLDGHWAGDGNIPTSWCPDLSTVTDGCAVNYIRFGNSGAGAAVQADRVRLGCAASHIVAITSMKLTATNRIDNDISIMFLAPHSAYAWDTSKLGDLCTATSPLLLSGATFSVDSADPRRMNVTLPKVGDGAQAVGQHYISCVPKSKHFTDPSLPVQAWSQQLFAIGSACSGGETIHYHNVTNQDWSHKPTFSDHVPWMNFTVPLQADSDWEVSLMTSSKRVANIRIQPAEKRFRVYNNSDTIYGEDPRFETMTEAVLTLTIDWGTLATSGKPTLTAKILDVEVTTVFTAASTPRLQMWYWYNSPHGNVTFQYGCEGSVPSAPRPALWPGDITSDSTSPPPITTEVGSTPPTSDAPLPTTDNPDTSIPETTDPTNATTIIETPTTVVEPTTTSFPSTTSTASGTATPVAPPPPTATAAPTATTATPDATQQHTVRHYRVRLGGASWQQVLNERRASLEEAIRMDVGNKLNIVSTRVVVSSLQIGSLIIDISIGSNDVTEPELSNATGVAEKLLASDTFLNTKKTYVAGGGSALEDISPTSSVVAAAPDTGAPTTPDTTRSPQQLDEATMSCARGCQLMILVVAVVLLLVTLAVACTCCCKPRQPVAPQQKDCQNHPEKIPTGWSNAVKEV